MPSPLASPRLHRGCSFLSARCHLKQCDHVRGAAPEPDLAALLASLTPTGDRLRAAALKVGGTDVAPGVTLLAAGRV